MWKFDADEYMKQVLVPALGKFKENGSLPDIFNRYCLPIDIADTEEIQQAVQTVTSYWNKTRLSNKRYESLIVALLKEAGEGNKGVLQDLTDAVTRATKRAMIEEERRKQREARFEELKESIGVVASKAHITPLEKAELLVRFQSEGFTAAEIELYIRVPVRETARPIPTDQGLDKVYRNRIRNSLGVLKKRDLYEFMEIGEQATPAVIKERHRELSAEWKLKLNDFDKTAAQELLGIVQIHLFGGMAKYEAGRVSDILDRLRPEVKLAAIDKRVSREEFNHLLALATKQGLEKELATQFILSLAEECGSAVEWSSGEETIRCSNCLADRPRREEKCAVCGADLWADCPQCKTRKVIDESACAKCGFVVANVLKVKLLVRKAQLALNDGDLPAALRHAREAERLWGKQGEVAAVLEAITERGKVVDEIRSELDDALAGKQIFAAHRIIAKLIHAAPSYSRRDGKTGEVLRNEIEGLLKEVEAALQKARSHEQNRDMDKAVFAYQEALQLASDAEDARQGLSRCPPTPPQNVRASAHDDHVLVEWAASKAVGNLKYFVVRREGRASTTPDDGEQVAHTSSLSYKDNNARPGKFFFYTVITDRGGTVSRASSNCAVLVTREVTNLKIEVDDSVTRGAWDSNVAEGRVRVYCCEGAVPDMQTGREITLASPQSFIDTQVRNGHLYYYRVLVEYRDARGQAVFTTGIVSSVKPDQPPKPIDHLLVTFDEGVLNLVWLAPPHGKVSIYRALREPEWKSGKQIPVEKLTTLGTQLRSKSDSHAIDSTPPNNPAYYVPVTIAGDVAVVGTARRFVALPDVTNLSAEDFYHYLQLRWQWPDKCQSVLVAWRADVFPQDAHDASAAKRKISRGEYERHGGFRIENPDNSAYKFVVFAATEIGGETIYSAGVREGARAQLRTTQPVAVSYSLSRGKLRRGRFTLTLSVERPINNLPEIVVVAKRGDLQPLRSDEGTVIASFKGAILSAGENLPFQFELNGLARPVYLRAFFRDAESYESYRLIDPPTEQLKIR